MKTNIVLIDTKKAHVWRFMSLIGNYRLTRTSMKRLNRYMRAHPQRVHVNLSPNGVCVSISR
jgi:membrane-bound lytic murein transglycosylase